MAQKRQEDAVADENTEATAEATKRHRTSFTLHVQYALSGDPLTSVEANESWTVGYLCESLASHVKPRTEISSLIYCDQVLDEEKTVLDCGLTNGVVLKAITAGIPTLHLFQACSSSQLAGTDLKAPGRHGFWSCGPFNTLSIVLPDVQHYSMDDAPQAARKVAVALKEAFPDLDKSLLIRDPYRQWAAEEDDCAGEVFVISNAGEDLKAACLRALAIRDRVWDEVRGCNDVIHAYAQLHARDWGSYLQCGFNWDYPEDFDEHFDADEETEKFVAMTKIMSERLTQGFMFCFHPRIHASPVIFGGVASDGSIVGVLAADCHCQVLGLGP